MKKSTILNADVEYELLDENQQDVDLRKKITVLYSTPFADILWWELNDPSLISKGYYKLFYYEQTVLKHIILFKYTAKTQKNIKVLNQEFKISLTDIENICYILFNEFNRVQQIIFEKIFEPSSKQSPKIVFEKTLFNDVIISDMPKSMNDYLNSLRASTRKKFRLMMNRFVKDFPDFKVYHFEKNDILLEQIEKVVSWNKSRMKTKGIISQLNEKECKILHQYVSSSGFGYLCLFEIGGQMMSGVIISMIGEHAYGHVIAHDSFYDQYSVGRIALLHTIEYMAEKKNIKHYHLLSGTQEYKFRFGGISHDLYTCRIFRNHNIYYFWGKTMSALIENYRKYRRKLRNSKTIYNFYIKLNKIKIEKMEV